MNGVRIGAGSLLIFGLATACISQARLMERQRVNSFVAYVLRSKTDLNSLKQLAKKLEKLERYEEAALAYELGLNNPGKAGLMYLRAEYKYRDDKKFKYKAEKMKKKAEQMARLCETAGKFEDAGEVYESLAHSYYGGRYYKLVIKAARLFEKAGKWLKAGRAYHSHKVHTEIKYYEPVMEDEIVDKLILKMAQKCEETGDYKGAIELYGELLKYSEKIGDLYMRLGKWGEAGRMYSPDWNETPKPSVLKKLKQVLTLLIMEYTDREDITHHLYIQAPKNIMDYIYRLIAYGYHAQWCGDEANDWESKKTKEEKRKLTLKSAILYEFAGLYSSAESKYEELGMKKKAEEMASKQKQKEKRLEQIKARLKAGLTIKTINFDKKPSIPKHLRPLMGKGCKRPKHF